MPAIGYGAILNWDGNPVGKLTSIGAVDLSATKVDASTLDSADAVKEIKPGMIDPGDVPIEGYFDPDDTLGQQAIATAFFARTEGAFEISFPSEISTTVWTGNAYITRLAVGEITMEGMIPFSATMSINGKPDLAITLSTGLTALEGIEENAGAALTFVPAFDAATYSYAIAVNTASDWIKLTATAAGVITVTALGVDHTLTTTVQSAEIAIGAADSMTDVLITVKETGKAAKKTHLYIGRP